MFKNDRFNQNLENSYPSEQRDVRVFKDPTTLTKGLIVLSTCWLIQCLIFRLFIDTKTNVFSVFSKDFFNYSPLIQGFCILDILLTVIHMLVLSLWVYRMNSNSHVLGHSMRFTPKWSVIWLFVPIANLWKGYQVFKDIIQANLPNIEDSIDRSHRKASFLCLKSLWTFEIVKAFLPACAVFLMILLVHHPKYLTLSIAGLNLIEPLSHLVNFLTYLFGTLMTCFIFKSQMRKD